MDKDKVEQEIRTILLPLIAEKERRNRAVGRICKLFEQAPLTDEELVDRVADGIRERRILASRLLMPEELARAAFAALGLPVVEQAP